METTRTITVLKLERESGRQLRIETHERRPADRRVVLVDPDYGVAGLEIAFWVKADELSAVVTALQPPAQ